MSLIANADICKGHSEMIWTDFTCSNFIIVRLNIKLLLAQHVLVLGYTRLLSLFELPDRFVEQYPEGVAVPLIDSCLCSFIATVQAPYPFEHSAACRCFLSANG